MKVRESGMPEEKTWNDFFDIRGIMKKMNITKRVRDIENPADCVTFCAGFSNRYSRKQRSLINGNIYIII